MDLDRAPRELCDNSTELYVVPDSEGPNSIPNNGYPPTYLTIVEPEEHHSQTEGIIDIHMQISILLN